MEKILKNKPISIIIPFYGLLKLTEETVASIKTKHPFKILLIDNKPTKESKEWLKFATTNPHIEAFQFPENLGVAASWNLGIKHAQTQWNSDIYVILNNDIVLQEGTIDTMIEELMKPNCALISATDVCSKISEPCTIHTYKVSNKHELTEAPEFSCFALKRNTVDTIGYFDPNFYPAYFEDNDYHHRLKLAGLKALKTNQAVYYHYGSRTMKQDDDIKALCNNGYAINREYYIDKWGGLPGEEKGVVS
jgi:GT2 family glycosyltransferase